MVVTEPAWIEEAPAVDAQPPRRARGRVGAAVAVGAVVVIALAAWPLASGGGGSGLTADQEQMISMLAEVDDALAAGDVARARSFYSDFATFEIRGSGDLGTGVVSRTEYFRLLLASIPARGGEVGETETLVVGDTVIQAATLFDGDSKLEWIFLREFSAASMKVMNEEARLVAVG